jgi:hypothetical protein
MRPLRFAACLALILALGAGTVSASTPATRGFLPPQAHPHGHSLTDLAGSWDAWGFGSAADVNPLLANRCEQSPLDPRIWFLSVSLGGDYEVSCEVPSGAFLVLTPGGYECSTAEGNGSTDAELLDCAEVNFEGLTFVQVILDGREATNLESYFVTSDVVTLPADNLFGADPTRSVIKAYFMVLTPMSRGEHVLRAYDEFAAANFAAGITYRITVG